jgi:hypothetical protein
MKKYSFQILQEMFSQEIFISDLAGGSVLDSAYFCVCLYNGKIELAVIKQGNDFVAWCFTKAHVPGLCVPQVPMLPLSFPLSALLPNSFLLTSLRMESPASGCFSWVKILDYNVVHRQQLSWKEGALSCSYFGVSVESIVCYFARSHRESFGSGKWTEAVFWAGMWAILLLQQSEEPRTKDANKATLVPSWKALTSTHCPAAGTWHGGHSRSTISPKEGPYLTQNRMRTDMCLDMISQNVRAVSRLHLNHCL